MVFTSWTRKMFLIGCQVTILKLHNLKRTHKTLPFSNSSPLRKIYRLDQSFTDAFRSDIIHFG